MAHYLFSQDNDMLIESFDKFDRDAIKKEIINHLIVNPLDTVEHLKDYSKNEYKRFSGYKIVNLYAVNPKNKKVSLIITRGYKQYFRNIEG